MIELRNTKKMYLTEGPDKTVLSSIDVSFGDSGLVCIVGESGCGKSTLLNILGGLDRPTFGNYYIDGMETSNFTQRKWDEIRNLELGFVFQDFNLFEEITVWENIELVFRTTTLSQNEIQKKIESSLKAVGVFDIKNQPVNTLSGGQKQRVAIARAMAKEPKIILADEPSGNLDEENSEKIFELLKKLSDEILIITVTHDARLAGKYANRIIHLQDGKIKKDAVNEQNMFSYSIGNERKIVSLIDLVECITKKTEDYDWLTSNELNINLIIHKEENYIQEKTEEKIKKRSASVFGKKYDVKDAMSISRQMLIKQWKKRFYAAVCNSLAFLASIFSIILLLYDRGGVIERASNNIEVPAIVIQNDPSKKCFYLAGEYGQKNNYKLYEYLKKEFGSDSLIKIRYKIELANNDGSVARERYDEVQATHISEDATLCCLDDSYFKKVFSINLQGNQIAITDYLADKLSIDSVGEKWLLAGKTVEIAYIVPTDYKEAMAQNKNIPERAKSFVIDNYYNCIYVNDSFMNYYASQREHFLLIGNGFFEGIFANYVNTSYTVAPVPECYGQLENNEVLLSVSYLNRLKVIDESEIVNKSFAIKDLRKGDFDEDLKSLQNLYKYVGESIKVVGVCDEKSDVLFSKNVYDSMKKDYYNLYFFNALSVPKEKVAKGEINMLNKKGFYFSDPRYESVYDFDEIRRKALPFLGVFTVLMLILTTFITVLTIGCEVEGNRKNVGILRSLGASNIDVRKLFVVDATMLITKAYVAAIIIYKMVITYINLSFSKVVKGANYCIITDNLFLVVGVLILMAVVSYICIYMPLKKMENEEIITNIKRI